MSKHPQSTRTEAAHVSAQALADLNNNPTPHNAAAHDFALSVADLVGTTPADHEAASRGK
jgi:hypothetical protein